MKVKDLLKELAVQNFEADVLLVGGDCLGGTVLHTRSVECRDAAVVLWPGDHVAFPAKSKGKYWFEISNDMGEEGTMTVASADTVGEAITLLKEVREANPSRTYFMGL